jgi:hypothetical protein
MVTVRQNSGLVAWVIVALVVVGILLHVLGPAALRTDEMVVFGLVVAGLLCFLIWLRWRGD